MRQHYCCESEGERRKRFESKGLWGDNINEEGRVT